MTWGGLPDNPFVGLRPFESSENLLFFGREEQTGALLKRLHTTGFVAVVGSSGSGKSSLVRAGLIPKLEAGFLVADRDRWHIAIMKPGDAPLANLAQALRTLQPTTNGPPDASDLRQAIDLSGVRAVRDEVAPLLEHTNANLLLVVDQFEEIFRFRGLRDAGIHQDKAADFVSIMLDLPERRDLPIYVVMTMRSDFLGDCDIFHGLPEALNRSQYLVPRLTRRQLRAAIEGPIHLYGGSITRTLVDRFLNDAGRGHDQLPVIQHALNRTWARWHHEGERIGSLNAVQYEAIGTLDHALDWHAEKAYAELGGEGEEPSRKQKICEILFKALTDKGSGGWGIRRPTRLGNLCMLAEASEEEVIEVIDVFRKPSRSFLMPPAEQPLEAETVIDISHESLMRVWARLKKWVDDEALSGRIYSSLAERVDLYEQGYESLLAASQLQRALDWQKEQQPNAAWAARYHAGFEEAMAFLEASVAEQEREIRQKEEQQRRELRRSRILAAVFFGAFLIAFAAGIISYVLRGQAVTAKNAAEEARQDAEDSAHAARQQRLVAVSAQQAAEEAQQAAEENARVARQQRLLAVLARQDAIENAIEADRQRRIADDSAKSAVDARRLTQETLKQVRSLLASVDSARQQTIGIGLASTARRQEANGQYELGALLARQAFFFDQESGKVFPNEVYDALRQTLEALNTPNPPSQELTSPGNAAVRAVAYSPDNVRMASGDENGNIYLWSVDASPGTGLRLSGVGRIERMAFGPDGAVLAAVERGQPLQLWRGIDTGVPVETPLRDYQGNVQTLAFSSDKAKPYLAAAGTDQIIRIWNIALTDPTSVHLTGHTETIRAMAFSPDGNTMVSAGADGTVRAWNVENQTSEILTDLDGPVHAVAFSPDGRLLITGGEDTIVRVWAAEGTLLIELPGHRGPVHTVAVSPDGETLATGSGDNTVRLWKIEGASVSRSPIILEGHTAGVRSLAFSPNSNLLLSGSADRSMRIWKIDAAKLADDICQTVKRGPLNKSEWQDFVGSDVPHTDQKPCPTP